MADWIITKEPQNDLTTLARSMGQGPIPEHIAIEKFHEIWERA